MRISSKDEIAAAAATRRPRNDVLTAVLSFLRKHRREVEFLALGVFLAGAGVLASLILSKGDNQGIEIIDAGGGGENDIPAEAGTYTDRFRVEPGMTGSILVDLAGAVIRPGVYRLPPNSRFADALAAAGGLSASADRNWVSRHLNLAQNISDGIKIYIPTVGENSGHPEAAAGGRRTPSGSSDGQRDSSAAPQNDGVSINSASLSELDALWGVGETRAKAIIEGRPYGNIDELVARKILPQNVVERNRERLSL